MFFFFATTKELGYNPDVSLVDTKKRMYTFRIPASDETETFYRTSKIIAEYRSKNISGRMARLWLVDRVDSEGKELGSQCVLKDVWLETTAKTEKEIQANIFKDINKFWSPPTDTSEAESPLPPQLNIIKSRYAGIVKSGAYKNYFLRIESDHVGKKSTEVAKASKPLRGLFERPIRPLKKVKVTPLILPGLNSSRVTYTANLKCLQSVQCHSLKLIKTLCYGNNYTLDLHAPCSCA